MLRQRYTAETEPRSVTRLRGMLAELDWSWIPHGLRITMSAGVFSAARDMPAEGILAKADAALYRTKDMGRNRVLAG
jgi:PleD family two-component response regulator